MTRAPTCSAEALLECKQHGVRNIVALRGDPPRGQEKWTATEGSCALVEWLGHPMNLLPHDIPGLVHISYYEAGHLR